MSFLLNIVCSKHRWRNMRIGFNFFHIGFRFQFSMLKLNIPMTTLKTRCWENQSKTLKILTRYWCWKKPISNFETRYAFYLNLMMKHQFIHLMIIILIAWILLFRISGYYQSLNVPQVIQTNHQSVSFFLSL